jgi:hypothetical protein
VYQVGEQEKTMKKFKGIYKEDNQLKKAIFYIMREEDKELFIYMLDRIKLRIEE